MARRVLPHAALALALALVVGWPALAAVLSAFAGSEGPTHGDLMTPPTASFGSAEIPRAARLAGETLRLVAATEFIALPLGIVLGLVLFRTNVRGRTWLIGLLALAAFVPLPLTATAWLGAFGNVGRARLFGTTPFLDGWWGAAFVHAMAALPWAALLAGLGFRSVEPRLEEAAWLDLPGWQVALRVTLRRALGPIAGAALAVAVLTAGDMTVTDLLQVRTYAEEAYFQFQLGRGPAAAGAVALPPLILLGGLILLGTRALFRLDPARLASLSSRGRLGDLGPMRNSATAAIWLLIGLYVLIPISSLVWHAGRVGGSARLGRPPAWSPRGLFGSLAFAWADAREPLLTSLLLAAAGATLATALAWSLAWATRRPGPWRVVVAVAVALSLAAPAPVAGMALKLAYLPINAVYDSFLMILLAYVLRTFPYALLILWPAVRSLPSLYLDAAAVDGLTPWGVVRWVALPLTRPATLAAWGVSFILALGELPAPNLVAPPGLTPLTVVIWSLLHNGVESRLAGIVLILLGTVAVGIGGVAFVVRRFSRRTTVRVGSTLVGPET